MYNFTLNEPTYRILSLSVIISSMILIFQEQGMTLFLFPITLGIISVYYFSSIYVVLGRKLKTEDMIFGAPIPIAFIYAFISLGDILSITGLNINNFSVEYILSFMGIIILLSNLQFGSDSEFDEVNILDLDIKIPSKTNSLYCSFILILSLIAGNSSKLEIDAANYLLVLAILISPFLYLREHSLDGSTNFLVFFTSLSIISLSTSSVEFASNFDIARDVYHSELAIQNSSINVNSDTSYSTILSVQAFLPWIAIMFGISIDSSILISHSLILSLVMVMIHRIYDGVFPWAYSGLAVFLPMTTVQFFVGQMSLWRQGVAELALFSVVSVGVLHIFRKGERKTIVRLFLIFSVLSHYSIGYVFLIIFLFANLGNVALSRSSIFLITEERDLQEESLVEDDIFLETSIGEVDNKYRNPGFSTVDIAIMALFLLFWHTISGNGIVITEVITLIDNSVNQLSRMTFTELFASTQVVDELTNQNQLFHRLSALFTGAVIFFGILGLILEINNRPEEPGLINFISMAVGSTFLVILLLIIPMLGYRLNLIRFVQWTIIFISPFALSFLFYVSSYREWNQEDSEKVEIKWISTGVICVLIILNSGLLFEVNQEDPRWNLESGSDSPSLSRSEYFAGEFATIFSDSSQYQRECIASDKNRQGSMVRFVSEKNISYATSFHMINAGITVHGAWNLEEGTYYLVDPSNKYRLTHQHIDEFWERNNSLVFDSGTSRVYYFPCNFGGLNL